MSLSEAALRKLTKYEVITLTLEYQAKFDNTLSNINRELSQLPNCFKKIESESSVLKNVNSKLHERVVALERQCWRIINIIDMNVQKSPVFQIVLAMMIWGKLPSNFLIS